MGFGSYDESEQENQDIDGSDIETGETDRADHEGSVEVEADASTDELVDRLQDMKDDGEGD